MTDSRDLTSVTNDNKKYKRNENSANQTIQGNDDNKNT